LNAHQRRTVKRRATRAHKRVETWARTYCAARGLDPDLWFTYTIRYSDEIAADYCASHWPPRHAQSRR
jgi:hypothetical protein